MSNVKKINTETFENNVLKAEKLTIVDFYADWCGPCKTLGPILDGLSEKNADADIVKVNVDDSPELASRYGIRGIPTMLFFKDGVIVKSVVGARSESEIVDIINSVN